MTTTNAAPRFRLVPAIYPLGATCLQRNDGNYGGVMIWRNVDTIGSPEWAADRLAVALGTMTAEECQKRNRKRLATARKARTRI